MGLYNNRIVVKVGTSTLTNDSGKSDLRATDRLVCTLADIHNMGYEVILVSSGAIAVGRNKLNMHARPDSMRMKQAAAAVGQCSLMYLYDKFFGDYDKTVAQILLNAEDIEQEEKKENLTNTFNALLEMGVIPIVNENDTVSTDEIEFINTFGDNDTLSALVAALVDADMLILLSDIDGLFTDDPHLNPQAEFIDIVEKIDDHFMEMGKESSGSNVGTGGMATKLSAARIATCAGADMVIANGADFHIIHKIMEGRNYGTLFLADRKDRKALHQMFENL